MKSTPIWLARIIEKDHARLRVGLAAWLGADAVVHGDPGLASRALAELAAWLRGGPDPLIDRRTAILTRSFVLEYLKQEGRLERLPPAGRAEAVDLLDDFLASAIGPHFAGAPNGIVRPRLRGSGVGRNDPDAGQDTPGGDDE